MWVCVNMRNMHRLSHIDPYEDTYICFSNQFHALFVIKKGLLYKAINRVQAWPLELVDGH